MTILTPQEVLQALIDDKKLEYSWIEGHGDNYNWRVFNPRDNGVTIEALLEGRFIFRLAKKKLITVGDVSFPKPESEPLQDGDKYWIADPMANSYAILSMWVGNKLDKLALSRGFLHKSRENAIAHAKALIKLNGGKVDE